MLKSREISDPSSCFNKAGDGELLFVLLGRDKAAPAAIRMWIRERLRRGLNQSSDPQITEARNCALQMERQKSAPSPSQPANQPPQFGHCLGRDR